MSEARRSPLRGLDDCGCCEGLGASTPRAIFNRPALRAVAYRTGTHSQFLASMLARLTSSDLPALAELRTRDGDDFSIALLDAWAVVADVLTFYQERIVNESFLRTATERRSLLELARLIGYPLRPGVAADAVLAFTLEQAPGAPQLAEPTITIGAGTRVQSVPGSNETAQTFETVEAIEGRVAWNALAPQTTRAQQLGFGTTAMYLRGVDTLLKPGDAILLVGDERANDAASMRWDVRILQSITPDDERQRTKVTWARGLAQAPNQVVRSDLKVYALRQRASLFGHNAPDPRTLNLPDDSLVEGTGVDRVWKNFVIRSGLLDLDAVYPKVVTGGWVVLTAPGVTPALFAATGVAETTRTDYAMSAKVTRITPDASPDATDFRLRATAVYTQSEELELAAEPLEPPLYGDQIALAVRVDGLSPGQLLAVSGARLRLAIVGTASGLQLVIDSGSSVDLQPHDVLEVMSAPVWVIVPGVSEWVLTPFWLSFVLQYLPSLTLRWVLRDRDGRQGTLTALAREIELRPASEDDEQISEIVSIDDAKDAVGADRDRTTLQLAASLANLYDRNTVTLNANVARANHGETVSEVLGSGDASSTYQTFALKQKPLTYVGAATASGAASTLEVRINDILWREVPTLFGRGPDDRVYVTRRDEDGYTTVQFGDGVTGARLPTGYDNVRATYRKGIGLDGLVDVAKLTQLMSRPLGLKEVTNPRPSENAEDPESRDAARRNAPLTVLTLDRTVSLQDYEDFTCAFAGVAKAHAAWIWDGDGPTVLITVAGPGGAKISQGSQTHDDLLAALAAAGDPHTRIRVESYREAFFRFAGRVLVDADHLEDKVLADVEEALRSEFAFERRSFGQPVMLSEAITVIQAVAGVVAVDVDALYRDPARPREARLLADLPLVTAGGEILAAELLTLSPDALDRLEAMT